MTESVTLVGFDIGTTTTRAAFVDAHVANNAGSKRVEMGGFHHRPGGKTIMTPFVEGRLDVQALTNFFDDSFVEAGISPADVFGGGALFTGLAARAPNARTVADVLRARVAHAVVANADDPLLESWLAFQGSVGAISRTDDSRTLLNLDIGGGTTNAACGRGGNVLWTDWSWIGARHIEVRPGTYVFERCSPMGQKTLERLSIDKTCGQAFTSTEIDAIVKSWVSDLETMVQQPTIPCSDDSLEIAFSGGVGEIVYMMRTGGAIPSQTFWGDLGLDLARAICASERLTRRLVVPETMGRATLYGLVEHQTQVSGTTVFLPNPERLPLGDLPVVATLDDTATDAALARAMEFVRASQAGAAIVIRELHGKSDRIRHWGKRLGQWLEGHPENRPLIVLLEENAAKALGGYATDWGRRQRPLLVLDEVVPRMAKFVHIGRLHRGLVFISFHGFGSKE